jgi:hypothetical protein
MNVLNLVFLTLIIVLVIIGSLLYFNYLDNNNLSTEKRKDYRNKRYTGITLYFLAIILSIVAFVYNRNYNKAEMPTVCNMFKNPNFSLRGLKRTSKDLNTLEKYRNAAKLCAVECGVDKSCNNIINNYKKLENQYTRLSKQLQDTQVKKAVNVWNVAQKIAQEKNQPVYWDPFPQVPQYELK